MGSDSNRAPEARCSRTGLQANLPRPGVPGLGHCRPKLPTRLPTDWHRRLLTPLSNTPQTKWCCSGSPRPIFRSGPLRHFSSTACHILARSSIRWPTRPGYVKAIAQLSSSCRRQTQAHTNASAEACAALIPPVWNGEKQNAALAGTYAKFTQNPAMKNHLLSTGNKASPMDLVWAIGLRVDDPRANDPYQWRGENFLGEALSVVRETMRESEAGSAHPASSRQFCTPTGNARIHKISSVPQSCPLTAASACQGPSSKFSTYFSDAPPDQSQEVLAIASDVDPGLALSEHGPCLVGGTVTLDDVSFTTKIAIHSGGDAIAPYRCVALLDTGFPQTFIQRNVLDRMLLVGAAPPRRRASGPVALVPGVALPKLPLCEPRPASA